MSSILKTLLGYLADYVSLVVYVLCFGAGVVVTALYYRHDMAQAEVARSAAVADQAKLNAKGLSDATNTILLAQAQYDSVKRERDNLLERLRNTAGGVSQSGSACATSDGRIAELQRMVTELSELAAQCQDGWQRCATRHDALVEVVK